jgi:hypothetical protein
VSAEFGRLCRQVQEDNRRIAGMVTKKPKGLGLGLEALLGPKVSDASHRIRRQRHPRR